MMHASQTKSHGYRALVRTGESFAGAIPRLSVLRVLILGFSLFLVVGLFHVWSRVAILEQGYSLVQERRNQEALTQEQRALTLKIRQLRDPARLEIAARRMNLRAPSVGQVVLMEGRP
jgi:cell division protein FtsL